MRWRGRLVVVTILAVGAAVFVWREESGEAPPAQPGAQRADTGGGGGRGGGRRGGGGGGRPDGPTSVLTAPAAYADVPVTLNAVGTAQALNTVTVKSQVDGKLIGLDFAEGQEVRSGDVIARIDPTIYQAQYDQAVAKKAQDEATLANARLDLTRYINLAQTNYGSKQQADTQRATVAQLEAQIKSDQGAIDNARAYLDYTTVRAPISGRTGIRLVDVGNIVHAADTTGLVVLTEIRPISVVFNLPQQNLRAVNAASAQGPLAVDALEADNRTTLETGTLAVVDNLVDQTTGTVKMKAVFPNARQQLWPGQFTNIRLTVSTLRGAVTVPTAAVQRGPNGAFVYQVADGKAVLKTIEVGRQDETMSVVTSGLTPPERVVTTGFARLTNGDPVRVDDRADGLAAPTADATRPPSPNGLAGSRRRREGGEGRRGSREGAAAPDTTGSAAPAPAAQAPASGDAVGSGQSGRPPAP